MRRYKALCGRIVLLALVLSASLTAMPFATAIDSGGFQNNPCQGENCFSAPDPEQIDGAINTERTFREQVLVIVNYFLSFVGLVAVIAIIYGGFLWVLSGGEEENVTKGRKIVLWAGAGIILILLSFTIVRFFINAGGGQTAPPGQTGTTTNPDGSIRLPDGTTVRNEIAAFIAGGPKSGTAPLNVELTGTDSRYPGQDQTIPDSAYHWSYVDRSGKTVELGSGPRIRHTLTEVGRFVFTLTIDRRASGPETKPGTATFAVEVLATKPEVNFSINGRSAKFFQQFTLSEAANGLTFVPALAASGGTNSEEFAWDFGDGTSIIKTAGPEALTHIYTRNGEYQVKLTITDAFGKSFTQTVTVAITDVAARFTVSPERRIVGIPLSFNANDARSSFGEILEYSWTIIDAEGTKEEISEKNFSRTFQRGGNLQVTLTVRDSSGKTGAVSEVIRIGSNAPVANFSSVPKSASEPSKIVFDGGLSSDIDNDPLLYSWDFQNDGSFEVIDQNSTRTEFTFPEKGGYNVKLRVKDSGGETAEKIERVEIDSVLNVDFTADRFVAHPGEAIDFAAEAPNAITYFWEFGDGTNTQGTDGGVSHKFARKGKYTVRLTVFNSADEENSAERTVFIGERDMPVAAFDLSADNVLRRFERDLCGNGDSGIRISRAQMISFDASASINRDGTNGKLEYEWKFHDGTLARESVARRRFDEPPDTKNCFPVILTVRDTETGKKDTADTLWLKVENAPPAITALIVSIPQNQVAPVIVPLSVQNARDPDGSIVEYKWWAYREGTAERIGLHTTTIPSTSIILPVYGQEREKNRYFFVVELKDNFGATVNSEKIFGRSSFVEVENGENRSPVVDFRMEKTSIDEGDTISFFAEASDPLGGTIPDSAYFWDFNGDNIFDAIGTGPQVSHRFEAPGEFEVRLKVVYRGLATSKSRSVFVVRRHQLPKAAFSFSVQGHNVRFNAAASEIDPTIPGNTKSFFWDFDTAVDSDGDGQMDNDVDATTPEAQHFYENFGSRSVKLTLRDRLGVEDQVTRSVPVIGSGQVVTGSGGTGGSGTPTAVNNGIRESIRLLSSHPLTSLDLVLQRGSIQLNENVTLYAFIKNADNSTFSGTVEVKILSGNVRLSAPTVQAVNGQAELVITGAEKGKVLLEITAKGTVSGDITEELFFTVE